MGRQKIRTTITGKETAPIPNRIQRNFSVGAPSACL
jgi:hypothetical protein